MARRTADGAGVGRHRPVGQAHAVEDAHVGIEHHLVAGERGLLAAVEGIRVLHGEFASAHDAETRPPLVAELGLDVIEILGHLPVAADLVPGDVGDHFFGGGLDDEVALMPVLDPQQFGTVLLPAPGLHPEFGRLHHRHQQFDRAGAIHFFADDAFDAPDDAQAHRHVVVDAARQLADHAGPGHQLMADDLGIGGRFLER